jgi:diguanylate cyclase (GGDEF)-like protein/PAS domain S-box-containing protein
VGGRSPADGSARAQARPLGMPTRPTGPDAQTGDRYAPVTALSPVAEAEMFRSIAVSAPDGVVAADPAGVIVWANDAAAAMFGWDPADLVGRPVTVLVDPDLHDEALELRRRVLTGEPIGRTTSTGLRRDGSTFPLSLVPAIRRTTDGQVLGMSAITRDLTHEQQVQRDLTEALARSHARFDQVAEPQALLDLDARFVSVNDACCRLLGWRRDQLLGRDARTLVYPVDLGDATVKLDRLAAGESDAISYEVVATRADGSELPVLIDVSLVRDRDGIPRELAVFAHDLSEVAAAHERVEKQDAFFRGLYRRAADPALALDADGRVVYASPAFSRVFGFQPEEIRDRDALDVLHPDDGARCRTMLHRITAVPGRTDRITVRGRDVTGRWRWFEAVATNALDDPALTAIVINLHEVTAEIAAREELRRSEERYRAIVETAQEGILHLDLRGTVLFANEKTGDILGVDPVALVGTSILDLLDGEERARAAERLTGHPLTGPEQVEVRYVHPDGTRRLLLIAASPLSDDAGGELGALGMLSDVTLAREAEAELRYQALHDSLTGLPNRALLIDRLSMAAHRQQRVPDDAEAGLAVLFLDLDHFKLVNDSRGHEAGDRLLVEVAARLSGAVRDTDTVARLGGDEFAVVCEESTPADADLVAERIQDSLRMPFDLGGEPVHVGASIGIAMSPPHSISDLLRFADAAMYTAKVSGRSRTTVYADSTESAGSLAAERRLAVATALHEALGHDGVTLGYQPIVDFTSQRVVGVEALIRWQHPTLGLLAADEVVRTAETAGLSYDLDRAVIRSAGRDLVALRERGVVGGDVYVSVNISPRTTTQQSLDELVSEMLAETGLPASCLALEITEAAIMDHADQAGALLDRLSAAGVNVAIDDFGTGYNSLRHLQRLPVRTLKIDQSFVTDLADHPEALGIARSVVGLARALGMATVAEGVEQTDQLDVLRSLGCDAGQGYLWGAATGVDDLGSLLATLA